MRVPPLDAGAAIPPAVAAATPVARGLLGAWSATRWEYTRSRDARRTDLVCDLGSVVTLGLAGGMWVLTFAIPGKGRRSVGGTYAADGGLLVLRAEHGTEAVLIRYRLAEETLTWNDGASGWDFDGNGEDEPATLVAVFVRL